MEVVASLSQGHTAAAQCGLFTHKSVPVISEPPCRMLFISIIKFCCYISFQNLLFIYLVESVQFMGHPKPQILNLSKYFIINGLLLHIHSSDILIIYKHTEFCTP